MFRNIQASNMSKLGEDEAHLQGGWQGDEGAELLPPDIAGALREAGVALEDTTS